MSPWVASSDLQIQGVWVYTQGTGNSFVLVHSYFLVIWFAAHFNSADLKVRLVLSLIQGLVFSVLSDNILTNNFRAKQTTTYAFGGPPSWNCCALSEIISFPSQSNSTLIRDLDFNQTSYNKPDRMRFDTIWPSDLWGSSSEGSRLSDINKTWSSREAQSQNNRR